VSRWNRPERAALRLTKTTELTAIVVVAITGELLFVSSLFVLGGEFWERIKALYGWPRQHHLQAGER
jgi:hypothetical protein